MLFSHYTTGIYFWEKKAELVVLRKSSAKTQISSEDFVDIFSDQELPENIRRKIKGLTATSISSDKLLMRVLNLPTTDSEEISSMVELQLDQISPFPTEQLIFSYELLDQNESHSRVLAAAITHETAKKIREKFGPQHVTINRLDAEIVVWWRLLENNSKIRKSGRAITVLKTDKEFSLIISDDGIPICFKSLDPFCGLDDEKNRQYIIEELRYTLLSIEPQYGNKKVQNIDFWGDSRSPSSELVKLLEEGCVRKVDSHNTKEVPSLAEELARRTISNKSSNTLNLVPTEWIQRQQKSSFIKNLTASIALLLGIWIGFITIAGTIFAIRKSNYSSLKEEAETQRIPVLKAQAIQREVVSLGKYADHSRSAIEILRILSENLPDGVKITSFNYTKGKAIRLNGTGPSSEIIYEYFQKLGNIDLFEGVTDQKITKDTNFSITIKLPTNGVEEER